MLYSVDSSQYVMRLHHQADYDRWRQNISDKDYQDIEDALNARIDQREINTAGWIPGHDWTGTVYEPIYEACKENVTQAGMFFGLIVFKLLMERQDKTWGFGRYEKDGRQIASMTYFELKNPHQRQRKRTGYRHRSCRDGQSMRSRLGPPLGKHTPVHVESDA